MGQYYKPYIKNVKTGEEMTLKSWDYKNGAKLTEHSWLGNDFVNAVFTIILDSPSIIGWIGDYADNTGCDPELYKKVWEEGGLENAVITPEAFCYYEDGIKGEGYIINHSKKEYISLAEYQKLASINGWCINPLPLLTAIGNGQGGGDYYGYQNADLVGSWYLDTIEYSYRLEAPEDCEDVTSEVIFNE